MPQSKPTFQLILLLAVVLLSRLPFLDNGYGAEEDSWGIVLSVKNMVQLDVYEASRFPGHPFQEYFYTLIWNKGALAYNLVTAFFSVIAVWLFILALQAAKIKQAVVAGIALAFVPVFLVNSVNNLDYLWALAFMMGSLLMVLNKKNLAAGLFLGMAAGCRMTSLLLALPFIFFIWTDVSDKKLQSVSLFIVSAALVSALLYIPAYLTYGTDFFTATDYFPYPPMAKVLYKGTVGVWGIPGLLALLVPVWSLLTRRNLFREIADEPKREKRIFVMGLSAVLLYAAAYIIKPEKSAYLLPAVPFVILLAAQVTQKKSFAVFTILVSASSFLAGINLDDSFRGSSGSSLAVQRMVAGHRITFDILEGPLMADYTKRKNKMRYTSAIISQMDTVTSKTLIIAGWWYNELTVRMKIEKPEVKLVFYTSEDDLIRRESEGYSIYYLAEQNTWNDLRYKKEFTDRYASAW